MPTPSLQKTLADWEVMCTNLDPQADNLPHLIADREALWSLVAELKALEIERESLKAALRETNLKRAERRRRGRDLTGRITESLRGRYGAESEELTRFGIKPRPRGIRRRVFSKAEKAARLAEMAARAALEAEAESRLQQALQPGGGDLSLEPSPSPDPAGLLRT
jgi:hypothetical protein